MKTTFILVVSGEPLGTVDVPPFEAIDAEVISAALQRHVIHARVVEDDQESPLDGFTLTAETDVIALFLPEVILVNNWRKQNNGTRRWYKEFFRFCRINEFIVPHVPGVQEHVSEDYPPTYGGVPIAKLAPLILQALAGEWRALYSRCGFTPRSWKGVVHSICFQTQLGNEFAVKVFIVEWWRANSHVWQQLKTMIASNPHQTYFD